jgi:hypothetical protein
MTVDTLKNCSKRDLARLAKDRGVTGWHAMRKDQLIRALASLLSGSRSGKKAGNGKPASKAKKPVAVSKPATRQKPAVAPPPRIAAPLPPRMLDHNQTKDRIVTMVRDPYWLHVHWELSRSTLSRARAAMGQEWHSARPILRVFDVSSEDTTSASERQLRDIEIHGGVSNWYIDVPSPPRSFRVDIGYLSSRGKFYVLARSNVVSTPRANACDLQDQTWLSIEEQADRIYRQSGGGGPNAPSDDLLELFEERLRRPMHSLSLSSLGTGALGLPGRNFHFEIDAELIVFGSTEPNAKVTLQCEPIQLRPDGTFTVRFSMPDARQIIPATASSPDGVEERTVVLAVERNTKELEPMIHDGNEL